MKQKINVFAIVFNGPKGSGKDFMVDKFIESTKNISRPELWDGARTVFIKARLKDVIYETCYKNHLEHMVRANMTYEDWVSLCNDTVAKEKPYPGFEGINKSVRQMLIDQSDIFIKQDGAGAVAVRTVRNLNLQMAAYLKDRPGIVNFVFVFSDSGVDGELEVLRDQLVTKPNYLKVVRLIKDGCNFNGDSRSYIRDPDFIYFNRRKVYPGDYNEVVLFRILDWIYITSAGLVNGDVPYEYSNRTAKTRLQVNRLLGRFNVNRSLAATIMTLRAWKAGDLKWGELKIAYRSLLVDFITIDLVADQYERLLFTASKTE